MLENTAPHLAPHDRCTGCGACAAGCPKSAIHMLPGYPAEAKGQTFKLTVKQCGQVYVIPASADEPLLIAIKHAGIAAPSLCRSGECGWCRSRMTAGQVFIPQKGDGRRYADVMYGYIHPCGSFPISDVELEVPGEYMN